MCPGEIEISKRLKRFLGALSIALVISALLLGCAVFGALRIRVMSSVAMEPSSDMGLPAFGQRMEHFLMVRL